MWLDNLILEGIQRLLILRLKDSPALDTIELLADTWIQVFKNQPIDWDESQDSKRIRQAFLSCMGKLESWPSPKTILLFLPNRDNHLKIEHQKTARMPADFKVLLDKELKEAAKRSSEQRAEKIAEEKEKLRALLNQQ